MKLIKSIAILLWLIICVFVLLTWTSTLEFQSENLRLIATFIFTSSLPLIFLIDTKEFKMKRRLLLASGILIFVTTIFLRVDIAMHWGSGYKTQTILYVRKGNPNHRIEFQMENLGAFGYNKRVVEMEPCCFLFRKVRLVDEEKVNKTQWKYIGKDVNELGLKFP